MWQISIQPWLTLVSTLLTPNEITLQCFSFWNTKQVTWLVVDEVRSERFRLVTQHRHKIGLLCAVSHIFAYWTLLTVTHVIFFIVECGIARFLCTMHAFDVRASSSSPSLPLCQILFLWAVAASIAGLACGEKSRLSYSLSHSPSLFDATGTEAFHRNFHYIHIQLFVSHLSIVLLQSVTKVHPFPARLNPVSHLCISTGIFSLTICTIQ